MLLEGRQFIGNRTFIVHKAAQWIGLVVISPQTIGKTCMSCDKPWARICHRGNSQVVPCSSSIGVRSDLAVP